MGIKIKNLQTGEFEKFNIPALKGEKGEPGEIEPSEKVDYIGKQHSKLRDTMNANVDYIIKTAIGEFNYLDYEGQHITATNSIEGHARSAILSGNTTDTIIDFAESFTIQNNVKDFNFLFSPKLNKKYMLTLELTDVTPRNGESDYIAVRGVKEDGSYDELAKVTQSYANGIYEIPCEFTKNYSKFRIGVAFKATIVNMKLRGDLTSVKMPVLTTTGKNLFNPNAEFNMTGHLYGFIKLTNNKNNSISIVEKDSTVDMSGIYFGLTANGVDATEGYSWLYDCGRFVRTEITNSHYGYFSFYPKNETTLNKILQRYDIQFEESDATTTYEPYKSNILTVNEDVELRGIGDVQDELNLITGEVTQKITKLILDGSEDWIAEEHIFLLKGIDDFLPNRWNLLISDKYASYATLKTVTQYDSYIMGNGWLPGFQLRDVALFPNPKNQLSEFKEYLSQNPITVYYQTIESTVKTVDLSDNHVYSYKGTTHYDCSSAESSLVPTLSVKVPTDTQLTIQEQKVTTQTLLIKNMDLQQSIKEVQAMNLAFNTALYNSFNSIREEVEDIKKHVSTSENLEGSF